MDPFLGEIRLFAGNFAPQGWAFCNGALLSIAQNSALFALLGTTYGGDGNTTFALPNLAGRFAMHQGQGANFSSRSLGEAVGESQVTLTAAQVGAHSHTANCATHGDSTNPQGAVWATDPSASIAPYSSAAPNAQMAPLAQTGAGQPHENRQPYVAINYIIALEGIFPTQN
ncbi:MAG: phage tail protein [Bryobacterales bacterium]|nr:phage tail protein [Bryobacterales bacterium]